MVKVNEMFDLDIQVEFMSSWKNNNDDLVDDVVPDEVVPDEVEEFTLDLDDEVVDDDVE